MIDASNPRYREVTVRYDYYSGNHPKLFRESGWCVMADDGRWIPGHGEDRTWSRNGKLAQERFLIEGKLEGRERNWDDDGRLTCELNWHNGEMHGVQRFFSASGKVEVERIYDNGKRIK